MFQRIPSFFSIVIPNHWNFGRDETQTQRATVDFSKIKTIIYINIIILHTVYSFIIVGEQQQQCCVSYGVTTTISYI